ncbi:hypothetical protein [uncultured Vibrio sp.]|uniref:hypothetical protein n=1 Tax=uncultured Vibrio sp. TaxID=114054 RepID=UPI002610A194|nr:hypothetical protein [uncultured Vibrio sp.]
MKHILIIVTAIFSLSFGSAIASTGNGNGNGNGNLGPIVKCSDGNAVTHVPLLICKHYGGKVL